MPSLSDAQFQGYEFRAQHDDRGPAHEVVTKVVAYRKANTYGDAVNTPAQPVGSMQIQGSGSDQNYLQSLINRGFRDDRTGERMAHGQNDDSAGPNTGQQRWTGGNMEPRQSQVSWLGMQSDAPKTLLKGMMGLGVAVHGTMPVADDQLSQYGSAISKGAARKYGVKPHPSNPDMRSTFQYADPDDHENRDTGDDNALQMANAHYFASEHNSRTRPDPGTPFQSDRWQTFSSAQVGDITKNVETNMLGRKPGKIDSRVPVHPSQGKLF